MDQEDYRSSLFISLVEPMPTVYFFRRPARPDVSLVFRGRELVGTYEQPWRGMMDILVNSETEKVIVGVSFRLYKARDRKLARLFAEQWSANCTFYNSFTTVEERSHCVPPGHENDDHFDFGESHFLEILWSDCGIPFFHNYSEDLYLWHYDFSGVPNDVQAQVLNENYRNPLIEGRPAPVVLEISDFGGWFDQGSRYRPPSSFSLPTGEVKSSADENGRIRLHLE